MSLLPLRECGGRHPGTGYPCDRPRGHSGRHEFGLNGELHSWPNANDWKVCGAVFRLTGAVCVEPPGHTGLHRSHTGFGGLIRSESWPSDELQCDQWFTLPSGRRLHCVHPLGHGGLHLSAEGDGFYGPGERPSEPVPMPKNTGFYSAEPAKPKLSRAAVAAIRLDRRRLMALNKRIARRRAGMRAFKRVADRTLREVVLAHTLAVMRAYGD